MGGIAAGMAGAWSRSDRSASGAPDSPAPKAAAQTINPNAQCYLENNVSYAYTGEGVFTFFSYDPHGNVDWMVQRIPGLGDKEIAYEYDLVSGNVTKVKYQEGHADQFFHRYTGACPERSRGDADNRIATAETSEDGVMWERDGRYAYLDHGPLRRLAYGEDKVQGLDHLYTANGWVKAINHHSLDISLDPAMDGDAGSNNVARDAWGMALGYFDGDFVHSGSTQFNSATSNPWHMSATDQYGSGYPGLYNGNISAWMWRTHDWHGTGSTGFRYSEARANAYRYDELNRISAARHWNYSIGSTAFVKSTGGGGDEYDEDFAYDAAGNIATLWRQGYNSTTPALTPPMDSLEYWYDDGASGVYRYDAAGNVYKDAGGATIALPATATNRLAHVDDGVTSAGAWPDDIDGQSSGNYAYNEIGELVDDAAEGFTASWTAYHKVDQVDFGSPASGAPDLIDFTYGPMQHRVAKHVDLASPGTYETTYYVHDASGNVMSIYRKTLSGGFVETRQTEVPIYGSKRLGLLVRDTLVARGAVCVSCDEVEDIDASMLRVVELLYDSPLSSGTENNVGEYIALRNTAGIPLPLGSIGLRVPGQSTYGFASTDTLPIDGFAILAYGTPADSALLRTAGNLPGALFADPAVQVFWSTTVKMYDTGGVLELMRGSGSSWSLVEEVHFGPSDIAAPNAHCDATCLVNPSRPDVLAVARQEFDMVPDPAAGWEPAKWASQVATGKGKGGDAMFLHRPQHQRRVGRKDYELADHLGNVRVVVSDLKNSDVSGGTPVDFQPEVRVMRDFYAFGGQVPGQVYSGGGYRFGFNGMERDEELKGEGNSYDFGARMYDSRLGRWWSPDALAEKYPTFSPYAFVNNMPIIAVDPNGNEIKLVGSRREIDRFLALLNDRTGLSFTVERGFLKKPEGVNIESKLASVVCQAIENPETKTYILGSDIRYENGDDVEFDDFNRAQFDLADFEALNNIPEFQAAMLAHVIKERDLALNYDEIRDNVIQSNEAYDPAHEAAVALEREILGEFLGIEVHPVNVLPEFQVGGSQNRTGAPLPDKARALVIPTVNNKIGISAAAYVYSSTAYVIFKDDSGKIVHARKGEVREFYKKEDGSQMPIEYD